MRFKSLFANGAVSLNAFMAEDQLLRKTNQLQSYGRSVAIYLTDSLCIGDGCLVSKSPRYGPGAKCRAYSSRLSRIESLALEQRHLVLGGSGCKLSGMGVTLGGCNWY